MSKELKNNNHNVTYIKLRCLFTFNSTYKMGKLVNENNLLNLDIFYSLRKIILRCFVKQYLLYFEKYLLQLRKSFHIYVHD